jgi:5-methyltetrahydropteroyltriglutamate--homocysteine methyltransferase
MTWDDRHAYVPDARFDGGNLDCGNGLLLLIRKHLDPLPRGGLLEILSTESTVDEDLPAWARMTSNQLVSRTRNGSQRSFLICKGSLSERQTAPTAVASAPSSTKERASPTPLGPARLDIPPLAVMGIGSWPRPRWMLQALHDYLEGRLDESAFQETADDAVRLAVAAQERAGVDVLSDGEQRRDSYASFVGSRLDACQLIPITDLLPYVEDPAEFEKELRSLDVPAQQVRHPAVFRRLTRNRPLVAHEIRYLRSLTRKPIKVALPGPYLLTRTLWLECVSERIYQRREELADDVVTILREEVAELLAEGTALIQFDEPVLTEVVFGRPTRNRSFMCGALGSRGNSSDELTFASSLLDRVTAGFPAERLALHICRGNWSRDERVALAGDYAPLLPLLQRLPVGNVFLEMCTPRAGDWSLLTRLPSKCRVGVGVVNQKLDTIESVEDILTRAGKAIDLFGAERVFLNPDCGFATFADNPVASADVAEAKLAAIVEAARRLRG